MVRALLGVLIESLAVVASDALGQHDLRTANGAPLTGLLADLARVALGPPLDTKDRERRQNPQSGAERTEEPAVQIPHEHRCDQQHGESCPEHGRSVHAEQPERLHVRVDQRISRGDEVDEDAAKDAVKGIIRRDK